jgi:predicted neutral ceramidase superfamily lipid hydrolase
MIIKKEPLVPERIRKIEKGFGFIPTRFLTGGFFSSLSQHEKLIYFLLVLASDRDGLSYYSQDKMSSLLELSLDEFLDGRNALIRKSLIAFNGLIFQVLSLPAKPLENITKRELISKEDFLGNDSLSIRQFLNKSLGEGQSPEKNKGVINGQG